MAGVGKCWILHPFPAGFSGQYSSACDLISSSQCEGMVASAEMLVH